MAASFARIGNITGFHRVQHTQYQEKIEYSTCRERGTKKKSESPTGIEPMTFRTPVGRSNH